MDLFWKYHEELQEAQRERNALRAENDQLKQQLEEKEKLLTRLKKNWTISRAKQRSLYYKLLEKQNQDKISFAVEQIQILANMITDRSELVKINENESCFMFDVYDLNMCSQELIRQLKGGK